MKKQILFLVAALALLLSACGGSPSSETADLSGVSVPAENVPAETEPPAVSSAENIEPPEVSEPEPAFEFDALQNFFVSVGEDTTIDDILSFVDENGLFYSENEVKIGRAHV